MPSRLVLSLSLICLALVGVLAMSCGSSNSSPKPCTGGPYNVVGDWQITVSTTGGGSVTGYGAIDTAGLALFFDNALPASFGDTLQLPTLTGTCAFSGSITSYSEPGGVNSGTTLSDAIIGNVNSTTPAAGSPATSITGSFTGTSSPAGTISAVPFTPLTGSVTAVTGSKTGAVQGLFGATSSTPGTAIVLSTTFTAAGSNNSMSFATTNEAGCLANGTFTEVGTGNVFDVSITLMPTCPITGTFTGIGFEGSSDYFGANSGGADTYLYADILDGTNTFVIEFY
jgi:hypothetical protein